MQGMVILSCWALGALQGAILILVPKMMLQGQLSALQLAVPLALGTFVFMCFSGVWGKMLDARFASNKPLILVFRFVLCGFLVSQLSFILLLESTYLKGSSLVFALCISRIIHGVFCSAIIPNAQLVLSCHDKKGEKLVWSSIAINIGRISAPLLTFVSVEISYFSLWFIATMVFIAVVITWCSSELFETSDSISSQLVPVLVNKNNENFTFFTNPFLLAIFCAALLISLFSSQLQFSLGPLLLLQFSDATLASDKTAALLFIASASALLSLFILYRHLIHFPKIFVLFISTSLILGSYLFVIQQQLFIAVALISSALSMAPTWYTALAIHANKLNKARTSATVSQGHTLGNGLGGLLAGALLVLGEQVLLHSFVVLMVFILLTWSLIYYQSNQLIKSITSTNLPLRRF